MTLEETLRAAGFKDEEIAALDPRVKTLYTQAEQIRTEGMTAKEQAELADRKIREYWDKEATPAINKSFSEAATAKAEAAFYREQAQKAKEAGFIPADAPGFTAPVPGVQPRNDGGQYVAPNTVPGAPTYLTADQGYQAIVTTQNAVLEYSRLYPGKVMPDGIDVLSREAREQSLPFDRYVAKKYDFDGRRTAIAAEQARENEEKIRKDEREKTERMFAERGGSNPDLRIPVPSTHATIQDPNAGKSNYPGSMQPRARHAEVKKFLASRPSGPVQ